MDIDSITGKVARDALRAVRYAKSLKHSPLLQMGILELRLAEVGTSVTSQTREWELGRLLDEIVIDRLAQCRGAEGPLARAGDPPADELVLLDADFAANSIEREAWSVLYYRYFAAIQPQVGEIADRLGMTERTLERRLARGHEELAIALRDIEREALALADTARRVRSSELPGGTLTFLCTSSGQSGGRDGGSETGKLAEKAELATFVTDNGGEILRSAGRNDADVLAYFASTADAIRSALAIRRKLHEAVATATSAASRCIAVHVGVADITGRSPARARRLWETGHPGQILLSAACAAVARDVLPEGTSLRLLGSHYLRDSEQPEHVWQLDVSGLPVEYPPLRSLRARPNNLPAPSDSFVGRTKDLAMVKQLQQTARIVSVLGTGGIGKTRLALQVAASCADEYPDGVWLVRLAAITDPTLVAQAICTVLGVAEEPGQPLTHALHQHLQAKQVLLVLDNCEHLVTECAIVASAMLAACPGVSLLVTSREPLRVSGERVWTLESLSFPVAGAPVDLDELVTHDSVKLFAHRCQEVSVGFEITGANSELVARICSRLDGIPLAIELAAARARVLSVSQIAERLDDRLQFLGHGDRSAMARHQTLRAAIDWSYELLAPSERVAFNRLSVFAGGFTVKAAEAVCSDVESGKDDSIAIAQDEVLDVVAALADQSLVTVPAAGDGTRRYRLLDTLRDYGREQLAKSGESWLLQQLHATYYQGLADDLVPQLGGAEQATVLAELDGEYDNVIAAIEWSVLHDPLTAVRLANAMSQYWLMRGFLTDGRKRLELVLPHAGEAESRTRARLLHAAGQLAREQGDFDAALAYQSKALEIEKCEGDDVGIAGTLRELGNIADEQGKYDEAAHYFEESLQLYRGIGDTYGCAAVLNNAGILAYHQGDFSTAAPLLEESMLLFRELDASWAEGIVAYNLGNLAVDMDDLATGRRRYNDSLSIARGLDDQVGIASNLMGTGYLEYREGNIDEARDALDQSMAVLRVVGDLQKIAEWLECSAAVAAADGDAVRAALQLGAAGSLRETIGSPVVPKEEADLKATADVVRNAIGDDRFEQARAEGRELGWEGLLANDLDVR